jgi:hypothetical protein
MKTGSQSLTALVAEADLPRSSGAASYTRSARPNAVQLGTLAAPRRESGTVLRKLRVFIASPGDVQEERDAASLVVSELQRTVAKREAVHLEAVRWETHAWPDVGGDAQDVINREVGEFDVFVGMMWRRFGTPTKRAASGTAEEFERAYTYFAAYGRPKIMFYFKREPFYETNSRQLAQFSKVLAFRKKLAKQGVLFWEYSTPLEFERRFREHLTNQLFSLLEPAGPVTENAGPSIYLSYKREDLERIEPVYETLKVAGFRPWLDVRDILPGSNWIREVEVAIGASDFFVVFLSSNSVTLASETGHGVTSETDRALNRSQDPDFPWDPSTYIIPVRLDPVAPPPRLADIQWLDLFDAGGESRLVQTIRRVWEGRQPREAG